MVELRRRLAERVEELEAALARIKLLQDLLPICAYCKKVRDGQDYWQQVEAYLSAHAEVRFTHCICPGCMEDVVKPELERWAATRAGPRKE
jgi:hypothetical protein